MTRVVEADYLVVGAGATGIAFTDALIDHAEVRVAMVDRRVGVGGHWLDAYPFVQLHQASAFYGVASTLLGGGRVQRHGPEAGLHERATVSEIRAYFEQVVRDRFLDSGRVELFTSHEYLGERQVVSRVSGDRFEVPEQCRIVDARYLAPDIPADTPPPFEVAEGARVIPVNDLPGVEEAPGAYVIVGSGKTATDACIWLLARGVDPDRICWVRPREPWMIDRALVQPDPVVFLGMVADTMQAAAAATSLDDLFLRLEDAGIMLRIDRTLTPTMAKAPTLGPGSSTCCAPWNASYDVGTSGAWSRADWSSTRARSRSRPTPWSCTAPRPGCRTHPSSPCGVERRSRCSRSARGRRASPQRWSGTSRRLAPTTGRRTGSALRRRTATP
jgi:hypothetical protein